MNNQEQLVELKKKIASKKAKEEAVKVEYARLEKVKKLTEAQRISRIEKLLGIE